MAAQDRATAASAAAQAAAAYTALLTMQSRPVCLSKCRRALAAFNAAPRILMPSRRRASPGPEWGANAKGGHVVPVVVAVALLVLNPLHA